MRFRRNVAGNVDINTLPEHELMTLALYWRAKMLKTENPKLIDNATRLKEKMQVSDEQFDELAREACKRVLGVKDDSTLE